MSTYVARITIQEIPDDPARSVADVTDLTIHNRDFTELRTRVGEILEQVDPAPKPGDGARGPAIRPDGTTEWDEEI